jgi:hypothetical protein
MRLVEQTGQIDTIPYELMLKTLSHIEVGVDGEAEVAFLAGRALSVLFYSENQYKS